MLHPPAIARKGRKRCEIGATSTTVPRLQNMAFFSISVGIGHQVQIADRYVDLNRFRQQDSIRDKL